MELHDFQYYLEENLFKLFTDLQNKTYCHGGYKKFIVCDNKKREISVATIRDRVVHRLVYDYLVEIYDKKFIYDAWSCRKNKGLLGAIERTQQFLKSYSRSYFWKADIKKFFDSVDHQVLLRFLCHTIKDPKALWLIQSIISSFSIKTERERESNPVGMPIGNLTSQIFANIYLNEFDRFVKHTLKPQAYLRYGDDFIVAEQNLQKLHSYRQASLDFLKQKLGLKLNPKTDIILKPKQGLKFLGVLLWPSGRILNERNVERISEKLNHQNAASYRGLILKHGNKKKYRELNWLVLEKLLAD